VLLAQLDAATHTAVVAAPGTAVAGAGRAAEIAAAR